MTEGTIRIGDGTDFLEVEVLERGTLEGRDKGDLRLSVTVRCGTFAGAYDQVWIAREAWAGFVAELVRLERERTGSASLASMSPDEFRLNLEVVDRAGHVAANGFLSRYQFGHRSRRPVRSRVEYGFDADPSLLPEWVRSFETLEASVQAMEKQDVGGSSGA